MLGSHPRHTQDCLQDGLACTKELTVPAQRNKRHWVRLRLGSLAWLCWELQEKSLNHTKSQLRYVHLKLLNHAEEGATPTHVPDEETGAPEWGLTAAQITPVTNRTRI